VIPYDEFCAEVQRRRRERWAAILAAEPTGRPPGRRPRDEEQERLLLARDRARLAGTVARAAGGEDPLCYHRTHNPGEEPP